MKEKVTFLQNAERSVLSWKLGLVVRCTPEGMPSGFAFGNCHWESGPWFLHWRLFRCILPLSCPSAKQIIARSSVPLFFTSILLLVLFSLLELPVPICQNLFCSFMLLLRSPWMKHSIIYFLPLHRGRNNPSSVTHFLHFVLITRYFSVPVLWEMHVFFILMSCFGGATDL